MKITSCFFLFFMALTVFADNHVLNLKGDKSYIQLSYMPALDNFTFEAWIINNQEDEGRFTILSWKNMVSGNSNSKDAIMIRIVNGFLAYSEWIDSHWMECYSSKKVNTGRPTSIAITKDNNVILFYINGEKSGSFFNDHETIKSETNTLTIGAMLSNFYESYIGKIDEIRLWNRPRTELEIKDNFQKELSGNEEDLLGYWNFENNFEDQSLHFPSSKSVNATIEKMTIFDLKTPIIENIYYKKNRFPSLFLKVNQRGIFYYFLSSHSHLVLSKNDFFKKNAIKKITYDYPKELIGFKFINESNKKNLYGIFINEYNQVSNVIKCNVF